MISAQQASLTAELNSANEIMQQLPTAVGRRQRALLGDHRIQPEQQRLRSHARWEVIGNMHWTALRPLTWWLRFTTASCAFSMLPCAPSIAATPKARRIAVKRALDIIIHLQARLRMDVGGAPAKALSEFYAAIFAQILQGSQSASNAKFAHAIDCVKNVRDAWRQVARDPAANMGAMRLAQGGAVTKFDGDGAGSAPAKPVNWTV